MNFRQQPGSSGVSAGKESEAATLSHTGILPHQTYTTHTQISPTTEPAETAYQPQHR